MTVYKGSSKIRDRGTFGVYKGSIPIKRIYKGSQLVYQFESYDPSSTLVNVTNGQSVTVTLKKGVYQLYAAGGGGGASQWGSGGYIWSRGGCSGGAVEGLFYLSEPKTVVCSAATPTGGGAGSTPTNTTISIDGVNAVTCEGGRNGHDSQGGGTGGVASFTEALGSVSCVATTGLNSGSLGSTAGSHSVSSKKWGAGGNVPGDEYQYGGVIIQYLRYEV